MSAEATDKILGLAALEQAEYAGRPHRAPCKSVQCVTCYPSMGDAYNAAIDLPAAPSPAAGSNSEGAVRKGSQAAPSGQTPAAGLVAGPPTTAPRPQVSAPASPTVPLGEAGPHSSDADAVGAPVSEVQASNVWPPYLYRQPEPTYATTTTNVPVFAPVDTDTADLLDLLAETSYEVIPEPEREWEYFASILAHVARINGGVIDQNLTRPRLHGVVAPRRIGPMFRRACREGLIQPTGYTVTDNSESGNVGRPAKSYTWLGGESNAR